MIAKLPDSAALWGVSKDNEKTGEVPTLYVGETREQSLGSCAGCSLLDEKKCYSQFGTVAFGHASMMKAKVRGKDYSLESALLKSPMGARMARLTAIGEITALREEYVDKSINMIKAWGLAVVGYIHQWRDNLRYAGSFMASCDTLEEVDEAIGLGFRATVVLPHDYMERPENLIKIPSKPFTTEAGHKGIVCPNTTSFGAINCNSCLLCDASKPGPVIGFVDHGPKYHTYHYKRKTERAERKRKAAHQVIESLTKNGEVLLEYKTGGQ